MSIALLATGNEIVEGDILNTNAVDLSKALSSEGLNPSMHLSVNDEEDKICEAIRFLATHHEAIIIMGGLGPTSDDRTRFALARFLQQPLVEFEDALGHICNLLRHSPLANTQSNKQQALFPASAVLMPNPVGTAMGCYCVAEGKLFFLLPGPPRECLPMFRDYVLPRLQGRFNPDNLWMKWRLFGVAESEIAHQFDSALKHLDCETGYRLEMPYVECKARCEASLS